MRPRSSDPQEASAAHPTSVPHGGLDNGVPLLLLLLILTAAAVRQQLAGDVASMDGDVGAAAHLELCRDQSTPERHARVT